MKRLLALALFAISLPHPFVFAGTYSIAERSLQKNTNQKIQLRNAYVDFLVQVEKKFPLEYSKNFNFSFIQSAFADESSGCFFGGWKSNLRSNGKCAKPKDKGFQSSHCQANEFECNPALFPKSDDLQKGACVSYNSSFSGLTNSCKDQSKPSEEQLKSLNTEALTTIGTEIESFCTQKPDYDACTALKARISEISTGKAAVATVDQNAAAPTETKPAPSKKPAAKPETKKQVFSAEEIMKYCESKVTNINGDSVKFKGCENTNAPNTLAMDKIKTMVDEKNSQEYLKQIASTLLVNQYKNQLNDFYKKDAQVCHMTKAIVNMDRAKRAGQGLRRNLDQKITLPGGFFADILDIESNAAESDALRDVCNAQNAKYTDNLFPKISAVGKKLQQSCKNKKFDWALVDSTEDVGFLYETKAFRETFKKLSSRKDIDEACKNLNSADYTFALPMYHLANGQMLDAAIAEFQSKQVDRIKKTLDQLEQYLKSDRGNYFTYITDAIRNGRQDEVFTAIKAFEKSGKSSEAAAATCKLLNNYFESQKIDLIKKGAPALTSPDF